MSLALIKKNAVRQGLLLKSPSAKGKDEFRKGWKERWFSLHGFTLHYYKKKDDRSPKGEIDLRAAKIDVADEAKTGKPHCLRVMQAKQVFTYLACYNQEEQKGWMRDLRVAAGYALEDIDDEPRETFTQPKSQRAAVLSFGALVDTKKGGEQDRMLVAFESEKMLRLCINEKTVAQVNAADIQRVSVSAGPQLRLMNTRGVSDVWRVDMTVRDQKEPYKFFVGNEAESWHFGNMLSKMKSDDYKEISDALCASVISSVGVEIGDGSMMSNYVERWLVVLPNRLLIFKHRASSLPSWAVMLNKDAVKKEGATGILVESGLEAMVIKSASEIGRDGLFDQIVEALSGPLDPKLLFQHHLDLRQQEEKAKLEKALSEAPPPPPDQDDEENDDVRAPVAISSAGAFSSFEMDEPSYVVAWGHNKYGTLGNKSTESSLAPVLISSLLKQNVRCVAAGSKHCVAVTEKGQLFSWGKGEQGELGLGPNVTSSTSPFIMTSMMREVFTSVACGKQHSLAITKAGNIYAWGLNTSGQLGVGHGHPIFVPQMVKAPNSNWQARAVCAGSDHSMALVGDNGAVWSWGDNQHGQLGEPTDLKTRDTPGRVLLDGRCQQIQAGFGFSAALIVGGRLYTWGKNKSGQLGHGDARSRAAPSLVQQLASRGTKVKQIACGANHTLALVTSIKAPPSVVSFGAAVLNGFREDQLSGRGVAGLSGVVRLVASKSHSVAVNDAQQLYSWGVNKHGELGSGEAGVQAIVKVALSSEVDVAQVVCGNHFTLVLAKGTPPEALQPGVKAVDVANPGPVALAAAAPQPQLSTPLPKPQAAEAKISDADVSASIAQFLNAASGLRQPAPSTAPDGLAAVSLNADVVSKLASMDIGSRSAAARNPFARSTSDSSSTGATASAAPVVYTAPAPSTAAPLVPPYPFPAPPSVDSEPAPPPPTSAPSDEAVPPPPIPTAEPAEDVPPPPSLQEEPVIKKKKKELPPNWNKVADPASGRSYYYNAITREVVWKRPKE